MRSIDVAALLEKPATTKMPNQYSKNEDLKQLCSKIEAEAKEINGGKEPIIHNGAIAPGINTQGKLKLVTAEMFHAASAHMLSFLSGTRFTSVQFYCGWCVTRATPYVLYNTLLS